jgi:hypothetical protein
MSDLSCPCLGITSSTPSGALMTDRIRLDGRLHALEIWSQAMELQRRRPKTRVWASSPFGPVLPHPRRPGSAGPVPLRCIGEGFSCKPIVIHRFIKEGLSWWSNRAGLNLKLDALKCMQLTYTCSSQAHVAGVWCRGSLSIAEAAAQKGQWASPLPVSTDLPGDGST